MTRNRAHANLDSTLTAIHAGVAGRPRARLDGLQLLVLGALFFFALGLAIDLTIPVPLTDFMENYYGARCLIQHRDPYQARELWTVYQTQGGYLPSNPVVYRKLRVIVSICTNLPTTLVLTVPLALLPWKLAAAIWLALTGGGFVLACYGLWSVGSQFAPRFYGVLVFLVMINSSFLLFTGNTAGLVISLCIIATCFFLRDRFAWAGIVCMAVSLLIRPHDAALIWLYFVMASGIQRKRALQSFVAATAIALLAVLWVSNVAPNWMAEYHSNLVTANAPGGRDDPGPSAQGVRGAGMIISLQSVLSRMRNDPHFYNPAAYAICGTLLLAWGVKTLRSGFSPEKAWLALAGISTLTLLPVYHRSYDARLLLLAIPACALLWKRGGPIGWLAMLLTLAGIAITGDLFWIVFFQITGYSERAASMAMTLVPLTLLALSVFYLWVYLQDAPISRWQPESTMF